MEDCANQHGQEATLGWFFTKWESAEKETLASMIGASRVRVTSTLKQLQRERLLGKRGRLMVVRPDALRNSLTHKAA